MALFLDTDDFKAHAPEIHRNYDWGKLSVKVDQVTRLRIIPFVSQAEYDQLETDYLNGSTTAVQDGLLELIQPAIAYFTYLNLLTTNRVQVSTMGNTENRSDDGTSTPASFNAIADVKEMTADMAYEFMDRALEYLEENQVDFGLWYNSTARTEIMSLFVSTTKILNRYIHAGLSRYTFLSMRSELLDVQINKIRKDLGDTFYNNLLGGYQAGTLSVEEEKVIPLIQAWQASEGMLRALPMNRIKIINGSIFLRSNLDGPERTYQPTKDAMRQLEARLTEKATSAKSELIKFLEENVDDYPDYTVSTVTLEDGKTSQGLPNNAFKRSFRV